MSLIRRLVFIWCIASAAALKAQVINNTATYRTIPTDHYVRIHYENDFFNNTDYYYTQGSSLELVHPALRRNPLTHLLVHPHSSHIQYGLAYQHEAFTPTSYLSDSILYGDRPFAAHLSVRSFIIVTDSSRRDKFSALLTTGIIGPGAGGYEIQDGIHRNTNNPSPHGWQFQVQNDVVLNYETDYEKALISAPQYFLVNGYAAARIGTLSTRAAVGLTIMGGIFNDPFLITRTKKWSLYIYEHPQLQAIGYDATLQGGLFNNNNPYTIPSGDISRITFENRYGFVLTYKWLYLEYTQQFITKEFTTGKDHHCGGIQISFSF